MFVRIGAKTDALKAGLASASNQIKGFSSGIKKAMIPAAVAFGAIAVVGTKVVKDAAKYEQVKKSFEVIMGGIDEAHAHLKALHEFAARTPFTIIGIEQSSLKLQAMGFEADEVIPTLKNVGDVVAGLGLGESGLERVILNLGQVKTQGKLTGKELKDFLVAGIPLIDELAKNLEVPKEKIQEMVSAGQISADDVANAFQSMSSEGGKFANLMEAQMSTFNGVMSNIGDSLQMFSRDMGTLLLEPLKKVAGAIMVVVDRFKNMDEDTKKIILVVGLVGGAIAGLTLVVGGLTMAFTFLAANPVVLTITGIILAIGLLAFGIYKLWKNWDAIWSAIKEKTFEVWNAVVDKIQSGVEMLRGLLEPFLDIINLIFKTDFELPKVDFSKWKAEMPKVDITAEGGAVGAASRIEEPKIENFNFTQVIEGYDKSKEELARETKNAVMELG